MSLCLSCIEVTTVHTVLFLYVPTILGTGVYNLLQWKLLHHPIQKHPTGRSLQFEKVDSETKMGDRQG